MRRLVWAFSGHTYHIVGNPMPRLINDSQVVIFHCYSSPSFIYKILVTSLVIFVEYWIWKCEEFPKFKVSTKRWKNLLQSYSKVHVCKLDASERQRLRVNQYDGLNRSKTADKMCTHWKACEVNKCDWFWKYIIENNLVDKFSIVEV